MAQDFNLRDFGIGLASGWASAFVLYQLRGVIGRAREDVSGRVQTAQKYAAVSAEGRYVAELVREAERSHILGDRVALSKLAVEPRFIAPPTFAAPPDDDLDRNVFRVVPRIHDLPWLHQPYNIQSLSVDDLGKAGGMYALLGLPGSGRTTALQLIALYALGVVNFDPPDDVVVARLRAEEENLDAKTRAERAKHQMSFEQRALDRMRELNEEAAREFRVQDGLTPYKRLLPIYVHLSDVKPSKLGKTLDPAEPLVRALQQQIHPRTAKLLPRRLYPRLQNGGVLVMLDGFDAQSPERQSELSGWLAAFTEVYHGNAIIVVGDVRGSGLLVKSGLLPVYLRPWSDNDALTAARKWSAAWPDITAKRRGRPTGKALDPSLMEAVVADSRGLTPSEITLKLWSGGRGVTGRTPGTWADEYLKALELTDDLLKTAIHAAALEQDEALITPRRLTEIVMNLPSGSAPAYTPNAPDSDPMADGSDELDAMFGDSAQADDLDAMFGGSEPEDDLDAMFGDGKSAAPSSAAELAAQLRGGDGSPKKTAKVASPVKTAKAEKPHATVNLLNKDDARAADKLNRQHGAQLLDLFKRGLIIEAAEGYQFRHGILRHYLAAVSLHEASDADLVRHSLQPTWEESMAYTAGLRPVDAAVQARLASAPDVRYSHLTSLARWAAFMEAKPAWRATLLRQLGTLMVAPAQFPALRERFAAALVSMRDPDARKIFDRALRAPDATTRRVAALGCGVLRDHDAVSTLVNLMRDVDPNVQWAAVAALGMMGTEEGYDGVGTALLTGTELVRQMAAETLADLPDVGYDTLYDAVREDDIDLRRAAIFGLGRVRTTWSAVEVYRLFLDDQQWYVRSAAQTVVTDLQEHAAAMSGLRRYPTTDSIGWLRDWVSGFGARMSEINPEDALIEMLLASDPMMQPVAAQAIPQLGLTHKVGALYSVLKDTEPSVRDTAQRALSEIELLTGQPLPAPA